MKARLFVVNKDTIRQTMDTMEVSVIVPEPEGKKLWNKTLIDIVSDLFQVEIGDYIFLWESGFERIYGVYRALSKPYFRREDNENDIFKIKIGCAYSFEKPIREYDVINNPYMKNKLWNIIGKKVAGKSRGTSPITPEEMQFLIQSLIDANDGEYTFNRDYVAIQNPENEITIDLINETNNEIPARLVDYIFAPIRIRNRNEVQYEKALEGVLNYMFRERNSSVINALGIECENVIWYANYLPYGLERSEIDYMVMESLDGMIVNKIDVIELMSSIIDYDHINRCLQYSKWVATSVTNDKNIVRPILICGSKSRTSVNGFRNTEIANAIRELPRTYGFESIDIYTYSLDNGITFERYEVGEDE